MRKRADALVPASAVAADDALTRRRTRRVIGGELTSEANHSHREAAPPAAPLPDFHVWSAPRPDAREPELPARPARGCTPCNSPSFAGASCLPDLRMSRLAFPAPSPSPHARSTRRPATTTTAPLPLARARSLPSYRRAATASRPSIDSSHISTPRSPLCSTVPRPRTRPRTRHPHRRRLPLTR